MMANTKGRPSSWYAAQDAAADDQPSYEQLRDRLQRVEEERDRLEKALRSELDYWTHLANMPDPKPTGTDARERAERINTLLADLESTGEDNG